MADDNIEDLGTIHAVPGEEICDFCSARPVVWAFPAREDFVIGTVERPDKTVGVRSLGGWAACDDCRRYVQNGDRDGLAQHSADRWIRSHPGFTPARLKPLLVKEIRAAHDNFWTNREGPGEEVTHATPAV